MSTLSDFGDFLSCGAPEDNFLESLEYSPFRSPSRPKSLDPSNLPPADRHVGIAPPPSRMLPMTRLPDGVIHLSHAFARPPPPSMRSYTFDGVLYRSFTGYHDDSMTESVDGLREVDHFPVSTGLDIYSSDIPTPIRDWEMASNDVDHFLESDYDDADSRDDLWCHWGKLQAVTEMRIPRRSRKKTMNPWMSGRRTALMLTTKRPGAGAYGGQR